MAKKKTIEEPVVKADAGAKNAPVEVEETPEEMKRALIKFTPDNLTLYYYPESKGVTVVDNNSGDYTAGVIGRQDSYVPTLTIKFEIDSALGESTVNLLKNVVRLIKRAPAAEFQLFSTYAAVEPEDESYTADSIIYRNTGASYIAYADFSNLSGFTVEASNAVNCTKGAASSSNVAITDQTKDASITLKITPPAPDPEPGE